MASNWGGYNPFGTLSSQASAWLPAILQMQQQKRQQMLQAYEIFRQMYPNQPPPQGMLEGVQKAVPGLQFPTRPVMTPGIPAVPGTPEVPGTPPASQDINAPTGEMQTPAGYQPETPGTPAIPPQPTGATEIVPPQTDYSQRTIAQVMPQALPALQKILGPDAGNIPVNQLQQIAQVNPAIQLVLSQTGFQQAFGGGAPGTGMTFGTFGATGDLGSQQIPMFLWDMKTGQPDPAKVEAFIRSQGAQPMTAYEKARIGQQQATQQTTGERAAVTRLSTVVERAVANARSIATGGGSQAQVHNALKAARDTLEAFKKKNPTVDVGDLEASIPQSQDLMGAGARGRATTARETETFVERLPPGPREAIHRLEELLDNTYQANPKDPNVSGLTKRLQSLYDKYHVPGQAQPKPKVPTQPGVPVPAGGPATHAPTQRAADAFTAMMASGSISPAAWKLLATEEQAWLRKQANANGIAIPELTKVP